MRTYRKLLESLKGSLNIFDIDETLFHTTAKVIVMKDGSAVRELSNQEYNTYTLKPGESYDYSQFKSAKTFEKSRPIKRMIAKLKAIMKHAAPHSKTLFVTARQDFDDKDRFLNVFRKSGIDIDTIRVERAGNIRSNDRPDVKKYIIINSYLQTGLFNKVRLFDDSLDNLKTFLKLQRLHKDVEFEAWIVQSQGNIKRIK